MTRLLHIRCSPRPTSDSDALAAHVLEHLAERHGGLHIVRRDLGAQPLPLPSQDYADALVTHPDDFTPAHHASLTLSNELIAELDAADILVLSSPVHNYTVPASLKTWIDYALRMGMTFTSSPAGKVGMLRDRPTFVVNSAGGGFFEGRTRQPDFFTPYITAVFNTIGIFDIEFIQTDRMAFLENRLEKIADHAAQWKEKFRVRT
jgi:FMN-dependent NADH-azoreductase